MGFMVRPSGLVLMVIVLLLGSGTSFGTDVKQAGKDPQVCRANVDCGEREYCYKDLGDCEGTGKCKRWPTVITLELSTSCGCDGQTYNNRWGAYASGNGVAHRGPCSGSSWQPPERKRRKVQ